MYPPPSSELSIGKLLSKGIRNARFTLNCYKKSVSLTHPRSVFKVIYQTRGTVFHQTSKHCERGSKNEAQPSFFNPLPKVFGYLMEHSFECFIQFLKLIVKCRENEGIKSIKISFTVVFFFVFLS